MSVIVVVVAAASVSASAYAAAAEMSPDTASDATKGLLRTGQTRHKHELEQELFGQRMLLQRSEPFVLSRGSDAVAL